MFSLHYIQKSGSKLILLYITLWLYYPKGPKFETIQSRLTNSISLEMFNPDLQNPPTKKNRGLEGGSLEIFNLA